MNKFTGRKTKGLKIFENDLVVYDIQKSNGKVTLINNTWFVVGSNGHKWDLDDSIIEGITIRTTFNQGIKVTIKTLDDMLKEFGETQNRIIDCSLNFTDSMEKLLPNDRTIYIYEEIDGYRWYPDTEEYVDGFIISKDNIKQFV